MFKIERNLSESCLKDLFSAENGNLIFVLNLLSEFLAKTTVPIQLGILNQ